MEYTEKNRDVRWREVAEPRLVENRTKRKRTWSPRFFEEEEIAFFFLIPSVFHEKNERSLVTIIVVEA